MKSKRNCHSITLWSKFFDDDSITGAGVRPCDGLGAKSAKKIKKTLNSFLSMIWLFTARFWKFVTTWSGDVFSLKLSVLNDFSSFHTHICLAEAVIFGPEIEVRNFASFLSLRFNFFLFLSSKWRYVVPIVFLSLCYGEIAVPIEPIPPEIPHVQIKNLKKGIPLKARIVFANKFTNHGIIYLPNPEMDLYFDTNNLSYTSHLSVSNLAEIHILRWKGREIKKSIYEFYPVETKVSTKNGVSFICHYNIKEINHIVYLDKYGEATLFTYFRDKWDKGRWVIFKTHDRGYPETHPHPRTVVRILFD